MTTTGLIWILDFAFGSVSGSFNKHWQSFTFPKQRTSRLGCLACPSIQQLTLNDSVFEPAVDEYDPAKHDEQLLPAVALENVPAGQDVHVELEPPRCGVPNMRCC
jgi:hypothetical protein